MSPWVCLLKVSSPRTAWVVLPQHPHAQTGSGAPISPEQALACRVVKMIAGVPSTASGNALHFGFLNRWNDTMATPLEHVPLLFAQQAAGERGWSPGKHC